MGRPPCCDKSNVKRGPWTPEEDKKILAYVSTHGAGNWASVPKKAGLKRCGKSCRLRWTNYLRPDLKHDDFSPEEEQIIITLHSEIGSRWSHIAQQLPGRTDNDVKNYWNTKLKKKLIQRGIDPVTHKPISLVINSIQGLYGGGGGGRNGSTSRRQAPKDLRISCLSRDMRNMFVAPTPADQSPLLGTSADAAELSALVQQAAGYDVFEPAPPWGILTVTAALPSSPLAPTDPSCRPDFILPSGLSPSTAGEPPQSTSYAGTAAGAVPGKLPWGESTPRGELASAGAPQPGRSSVTVDGDPSSRAAAEAAGPSSLPDIDSFVESLLSRDDEIMWGFPEFLEDHPGCD